MNILTEKEAWQLQIIMRCIGQIEVIKEGADENYFNLMTKNEIVKAIHEKGVNENVDFWTLILEKLDRYDFSEVQSEIIELQLDDVSLCELKVEIGKILREKREKKSVTHQVVLNDLKNNYFSYTNAYGYSDNLDDVNIIAKLEAGEDFEGFDCLVSDYATYLRLR